MRSALRLSRLLGFRILGALLQFFTLVTLARASTLEDFGAYAALLGLGALASGAFGMGLTTRALRIKSEGVRVVLTFVVGNLLATGLLVASLLVVSLTSQGSVRSWAIAAAFASANELASGFAQSLLFGREKIGLAEVVVLSRRLLPVLALSVGLLISADVFVSFAAGSATAVLVALGMLLPIPRGGFSIKTLILDGRHYWAASIWSMAQQADVSLIAALAGPSQSGGYGAAFRLASPVHLVTTSITSLIVPRMSGEGAWGDKLARGVTLRRLGYGYGVCVMLFSPLAAWLGPIILGTQYLPFAWVFCVMVATAGVSVLNQIQISVMYAAGRQRTVSWDTAFGSVLGLCLVAVGAIAGGAFLAVCGYGLSRVLLSLVLKIQLDKVNRLEEGATE